MLEQFQCMVAQYVASKLEIFLDGLGREQVRIAW